ncbi:hypothetical protein GCM10010990_34470 [Croceicoccus mobilis]|uniref:C4-dicarboxylate ABC transporter substrate-binding protein n=2 Tax=Croceicoccus mobilis TaxID=1703339 RepID=A0A917DXS3_9SPHN|nr:hypothetical protein GCM10010990_34470 [Croceicoccus mobilis]
MFRLLALLALAMAAAAPAQAGQPVAIAGTGEHGATAGGPLEWHKAIMPAVQNALRADDFKKGGGGKATVPFHTGSVSAGADADGQSLWFPSRAGDLRQSAPRANRARGPPRI